jgi:hypothetical protein
LLYKAYNGKLPNAKASVVHFSITPKDDELKVLTAENVLKLLNKGLSDRNLIKRLFDEQMTQNIPFPTAAGIIWELNTAYNINYSLVTSENWINKEDIIASEFEKYSLINGGRGLTSIKPFNYKGFRNWKPLSFISISIRYFFNPSAAFFTLSFSPSLYRIILSKTHLSEVPMI